jgi:hypothetical protein
MAQILEAPFLTGAKLPGEGEASPSGSIAELVHVRHLNPHAVALTVPVVPVVPVVPEDAGSTAKTPSTPASPAAGEEEGSSPGVATPKRSPMLRLKRAASGILMEKRFERLTAHPLTRSNAIRRPAKWDLVKQDLHDTIHQLSQEKKTALAAVSSHKSELEVLEARIADLEADERHL